MSGAALLSIGGCSSAEDVAPDSEKQEEATPTPNQYTFIDLDTRSREIVSVSNDFGFKLFSEILSKSESGENVTISPFSTFSVAAMMANADKDESRDEILRVFGVEESETGMATVNDYLRTMNSALPSLDNQCKFNNANSLWANIEGFSVRETFLQTMSDVFEAQLRKVSPSGESGMREINSWVAENTKGNLNEFLTTPMEDIDLALVNALYFKGKWNADFDKGTTAKGKFNNYDGTSAQVDFMTAENEVLYGETDDMKGISILYGNGNYKFYAIMPSVGSDFDSLMEGIDSDRLSSLLSRIENPLTTVRMPKFESTFNGDILGNLEDMGIRKTTEYGLNSLFAEGEGFVKCFRHAVTFKADEEGAEASAASLGGIWVGADVNSPEPEPIEITFDRPFIYMVRETTTGTILFLGAIRNL